MERRSVVVTVNRTRRVTGMEGVPLDASALPSDPALPGLALLGRPAELTATLSRVLAPWLGPDRHLRDSRASLRRLAPGKRCSVELELDIGGNNGLPAGRRRVLGKFYGEDQGATVYQTLGELRRHGLGAGRFAVPEPLAWEPAHRLLLVTWAEGESLSAVVLARPDASPEIEGAAEWLLALHQCGVGTGRRYSFLGHLRTLAGWKELLAAVYPAGERLLEDLLGRFEERGRELSGWAPGPTHRDFSPEHLVVRGNQFTGLDFDEFCQYDPLFDVAHFVAHLRFLGLTEAGALKHFDGLAQRFLARYEAGGGECSEERLRLYTAIAYFKLGRFVALVQRPPAWTRILPELLNEARRLV